MNIISPFYKSRSQDSELLLKMAEQELGSGSIETKSLGFFLFYHIISRLWSSKSPADVLLKFCVQYVPSLLWTSVWNFFHPQMFLQYRPHIFFPTESPDGIQEIQIKVIMKGLNLFWHRLKYFRIRTECTTCKACLKWQHEVVENVVN